MVLARHGQGFLFFVLFRLPASHCRLVLRFCGLERFCKMHEAVYSPMHEAVYGRFHRLFSMHEVVYHCMSQFTFIGRKPLHEVVYAYSVKPMHEVVYDFFWAPASSHKLSRPNDWKPNIFYLIDAFMLPAGYNINFFDLYLNAQGMENRQQKGGILCRLFEGLFYLCSKTVFIF